MLVKPREYLADLFFTSSFTYIFKWQPDNITMTTQFISKSILTVTSMITQFISQIILTVTSMRTQFISKASLQHWKNCNYKYHQINETIQILTTQICKQDASLRIINNFVHHLQFLHVTPHRYHHPTVVFHLPKHQQDMNKSVATSTWTY